MMQEIEYLTLQDMVVVVVIVEGIMTEIEIIIIDHIWMKKTIIGRIVEILKTDLVDTVVMIEDINFFVFCGVQIFYCYMFTNTIKQFFTIILK